MRWITVKTMSVVFPFRIDFLECRRSPLLMELCGASEAKVMVVHDHGYAVEFVLIKSVES